MCSCLLYSFQTRIFNPTTTFYRSENRSWNPWSSIASGRGTAPPPRRLPPVLDLSPPGTSEVVAPQGLPPPRASCVLSTPWQPVNRACRSRWRRKLLVVLYRGTEVGLYIPIPMVELNHYVFGSFFCWVLIVLLLLFACFFLLLCACVRSPLLVHIPVTWFSVASFAVDGNGLIGDNKMLLSMCSDNGYSNCMPY